MNAFLWEVIFTVMVLALWGLAFSIRAGPSQTDHLSVISLSVSVTMPISYFSVAVIKYYFQDRRRVYWLVILEGQGVDHGSEAWQQEAGHPHLLARALSRERKTGSGLRFGSQCRPQGFTSSSNSTLPMPRVKERCHLDPSPGEHFSFLHHGGAISVSHPKSTRQTLFWTGILV